MDGGEDGTHNGSGSSDNNPAQRTQRRKHLWKITSTNHRNEDTLFFPGGLVRYDKGEEFERVRKDAIQSKAGKAGLDEAEQQGGLLARERYRLTLIVMRALPKLGWREFGSGSLWRASVIEFVGTLQLVFLSCAISIAVLRSGYDPPSQAISLLNIPLLAFYILAGAAASGGHYNPLITLSTVITRLSSVARAILYIPAQLLGATAGAALLRCVVGDDVAQQTQLGGCLTSRDMPPGRALVMEILCDFCALFVSYGVALDPSQGPVVGAVLAPFFVSSIFALASFSSSLLAPPPFTGAALNPARCLGPAVALAEHYEWKDTWVYYIGAIVAAILHGLLYDMLPPSHAAVYKELQETVQAKCDTNRSSEAAEDEDEELDEL